MEQASCKKCGSNKLMKDLRIHEQGHSGIPRNLSIDISKTDRAFFNKYEKGEILAQVCGNCGNMELSVSNFRELWEAYNK